MGNLPSKFGHARPLGSRIIRCVRNTDRQTERQMDGQKQRLLPPSHGRGHKKSNTSEQKWLVKMWRKRIFTREYQLTSTVEFYGSQSEITSTCSLVFVFLARGGKFYILPFLSKSSPNSPFFSPPLIFLPALQSPGRNRNFGIC